MTILKADSVLRTLKGQDDPRGVYTETRLSDAAGLSQSGAVEEELSPGACSSYAHWHAAEDEMVYVLSGTLTAVENGVETVLTPGDAVCWKAGKPVAHHLINHSGTPARYLVIGTRALQDTVTYPEHDRILHIDRSADTRCFTTLSGVPCDPIKG